MEGRKKMIERRDLQEDIFNGAMEEWLLREVEEDHPLLKLYHLLKGEDLVGQEIRGYYSRGEGRPSKSPEILLRMNLLEYLYNLSDREVVRECKVNFLFRLFVGLKPFERVPDDTTLVKFRARLGKDGFKEIFDRYVAKCNELGLVKGKLKAIDATHIIADVAIPTTAELIRQGRERIIKKVKEKDERRAKELENRYKSPKKRGKVGKEELLKEVELTEALLSEVEGDEEVKEVAFQVEDLLRGNPEKVVSWIDPEAKVGYKSPKKSFLGYKVHAIVDEESGLVTTIDTLPGNENEGAKLKEMVEEELSKGLKMEEMAADKLYDSGENRRYLRERDIAPYIPFRVNSPQIEDFFFDGQGLRCPAGKYTQRYIPQGAGELYYFSVSDCSGCDLKGRCVSPSEVRKKVYLSTSRREKLLYGQVKEERKDRYRRRSVIERKFGEAKKWHGLGRARFRGFHNVAIQSLLTFLVMNLKRVAKLIPSSLESQREKCVLMA